MSNKQNRRRTKAIKKFCSAIETLDELRDDPEFGAEDFVGYVDPFAIEWTITGWPTSTTSRYMNSRQRDLKRMLGSIAAEHGANVKLGFTGGGHIRAIPRSTVSMQSIRPGEVNAAGTSALPSRLSMSLTSWRGANTSAA
jgi:hypothetical protein